MVTLTVAVVVAVTVGGGGGGGLGLHALFHVACPPDHGLAHPRTLDSEIHHNRRHVPWEPQQDREEQLIPTAGTLTQHRPGH